MNKRAVSAALATARFFKPTLTVLRSYVCFWMIAAVVGYFFSPITGTSILSALPPATLLIIFFGQSFRWRLLCSLLFGTLYLWQYIEFVHNVPFLEFLDQKIGFLDVLSVLILPLAGIIIATILSGVLTRRISLSSLARWISNCCRII